MAHLFLTVSTLPPASESTSEAVSYLRASLGESFPRLENGAYLDALTRGTAHAALARLTALSLLPRLLEAAGRDSRDCLLARDRNGRPYVSNAPDLDFNLSHSDIHATCALLIGGGRVGVDVEESLSPDRAARLMSRYATDGERALFDVVDPEPWEGFVRLWTWREALAKQDGRGQPLNFHATDVPSGVCLCSGHLSDTGAAIALCAPGGIELTNIRYATNSPSVIWHLP